MKGGYVVWIFFCTASFNNGIADIGGFVTHGHSHKLSVEACHAGRYISPRRPWRFRERGKKIFHDSSLDEFRQSSAIKAAQGTDLPYKQQATDRRQAAKNPRHCHTRTRSKQPIRPSREVAKVTCSSSALEQP
jgi:hypothetical protein